MIFAVVCVTLLKFNTPLGYPLTLNLFAILSLFWILEELAYYTNHEPWKWLEWLGSWSYSIYLMHMVVWAGIVTIWPWEALGFWGWSLTLAGCLLGSLVFYLAVEFPSHQLARFVGRQFSAKRIKAASVS
jgi:peptidoglycan/LPS O-acetylase OafA/YrhL